MDKSNNNKIYQQEYIDLISEKYNKPIVDMVDSNNNFIHPTAIVGSNVVLGKNNYIGANCYIVGNVTIGDNNHFEAFCSIGTFPEHKTFFNDKKMKGVVIGNDNVLREFVTINSGCLRDTTLESNIWLQKGSYVGHDSEILNGTTLSINAVIGGHCLLGRDVNLGIGAMCHQFSVIGSGSMIGMGAIVTKTSQIKPLGTYIGNPCRYLKDNHYRLSRLSESEKNWYDSIYERQLSEMKKIKSAL